MNHYPVNLQEKLGQFGDYWSPKIVARFNDNHLKLAKVQGDFVWHSHPGTDEVFLVLKGRLLIEFRDGTVTLDEGELYVVPKGVEHKPFAENECRILLIDPAGTINTGDAFGAMTAPNDVWI